MVGQTICSRPTRGPATRRINSCLERHRLRRRTTTTTAFSRWGPKWPTADAPRRATARVALINPQGVQFRTDFPLLRAPDSRRSSRRAGCIMALLWQRRPGHWEDLEPDGIWIAPNSIKHICVAEDGKCTGKEWTSHIEFAPSAILSDISTECKLRGVSWVIPDSFDSDHSWDVRNIGGPSWVASIVNAVGHSTCTEPLTATRIGTARRSSLFGTIGAAGTIMNPHLSKHTHRAAFRWDSVCR